MKYPLQYFVLIIIYLILSVACGDRPPPSATVEDPLDGPLASSRLAGLLGSGSDASFPRVTEPREFRFPGDHGPHPAFRNEWWYVTGNVDSADGQRFGYELTLFRFALAPSSAESEPAAGWRTSQVFVGHFAISDPQRDEFHVAERYARAGLGLAGAAANPFRVWLGSWQIAADTSASDAGDLFRLQASDGPIALDLELRATKPPVLNGEAGLSRKSSEPGNASYYYSMSRLATTGSVTVGGRDYEVSGDSWLDREWGSSALSGSQIGWDWFALQLDDGSELMFYNIRSEDGLPDAMSAGTFIARDGSATGLVQGDVDITVLRQWQSPAGGVYPARWRLDVASLGLSVEIAPIMDDQELATAVRYWEGAVDVSGIRGGQSLRGRGYVELTGYAR